MTTATLEGVWQYKGRWRSPIGYALLLLFSMAAVMLAAAMAGAHFSVLLALGALPFAALGWVIGKPLLTGAWIVRIGPRGISGHVLNGRTVPWRDVRDIGVEVVQGNTTLVITLAEDATESIEKTRRWLTGRKLQRRIPLAGLKPAEIEEAVGAAQRTFAERASPHAAAAVQARAEEARFEADFARELATLTPTTWALYLVVALNVGVWAANVVGGLSAFRPASADLFRWGANSAWAVTRDHEYWRLLTATFLHGGLVHLAMNMLGLWGAGLLLNRLYGNAQFLLVYLASALAGSAASLHFGAQTAVSVGASGAVFGVLGAVLVAAHRHRERLPKSMTRSIVTSEGVFLAYALFNGFFRAGIDNAAHVGGLLAGAALAGVLVGRFGPRQGERRALRAAAAAGGMALAVVALVAVTPAPRVDHGTIYASGDAFPRVAAKLQAASTALGRDADAVKAGRMTEQQFVEAVEKTHLPALRAGHVELITNPLGQGDPRADIHAAMGAYTGHTVEALELQVRIAKGEGGPDADAEAKRVERQLELSGQRLRAATEAAKKKP